MMFLEKKNTLLSNLEKSAESHLLEVQRKIIII